jgi:hypothetical protein
VNHPDHVMRHDMGHRSLLRENWTKVALMSWGKHGEEYSLRNEARPTSMLSSSVGGKSLRHKPRARDLRNVQGHVRRV